MYSLVQYLNYIVVLVMLLLVGCDNKAPPSNVSNSYSNPSASNSNSSDKSLNAPLVETVFATTKANTFTITGHGFVQPVDQIDVVSELAGKVESVSKNFIVGGRIAKGDMLFRIEPEVFDAELKQAQARLNSAKAQRENAQTQLKRVDALIDDNLISQERRDLTRVELIQAKANYEQAQAALILAKERKSDTVVSTPFNAKVVSESLSVGAFVSPGQVLGTIYHADKIEIVVGLSQKEAQSVKRALALKADSNVNNMAYPVSVYAQSLKNGIQSTPFIGYIRSISPQLDTRSRVVNFIIHVPFSAEQLTREVLLLGQYVAVDFTAQSPKTIYTVPEGVIRKERFLFMVKDDSTLEKRPVTVLSRDKRIYFTFDNDDKFDKKTPILKTSLAQEQPGLKVRLKRNNAEQSKQTGN